MRNLALIFVFVASSAAAAAPPRLHFEVRKVSATGSAPAEVSVNAKAILTEVLTARPEYVASAGKGVRSYGVTLNVDRYARSLEPNTKPGASGQVLTLSVGVQLVGESMPGGLLAMAGSGSSTVTAEVGATLRPREEEQALGDALRDALTHAVNDAVARLAAGPPKASRPPKRKPK